MMKPTLIGLLQSGKDELARTVAAVPDDKMTWKPLDNGRSALELLSDAAQTAALAAQIVASRGEHKPSHETFQQMREERANWTRETAMAQLDSNFDSLKTAIAECPDEELAAPVTMPIGGGMTLPLGGWAMMAYRSYISRFAQINYIQSLYGDFESH